MDVHHFRWLLRNDRKDAGLWLTAFLAVLFQGIEIGILIAVILSLARACPRDGYRFLLACWRLAGCVVACRADASALFITLLQSW
jgi:hypothetical protein